MARLRPLISELKSLIERGGGGGHGGGGHVGGGHGHTVGGWGPGWWGPGAPCPPGSVLDSDGNCLEPVIATTPEADD